MRDDEDRSRWEKGDGEEIGGVEAWRNYNQDILREKKKSTF